MNLKQYKEVNPDKILDSNVAAFNQAKKLGDIVSDEIVLASKPFFTIQGEGIHSGTPAIFFRTAYCSLQCHFCSVEDTMIDMASGNNVQFPIKDIKPGMKILNKDIETDMMQIEAVTEVIEREVDPKDMLVIQFFGMTKPLIVTKDHLFLTRGKEWIKAKDLSYNASLIGDSSSFGFHKSVAEVRSLNTYESEKYIKDGKVKVYSLRLETNKNYFTNGVLSHNCDTPEWMTKRYNYSFNGLVNSFKEAHRECKLLIMTGGEPTLQLSKELLDHFHNEEYKVNIETSGSFWNENIQYIDFVCVSPKRLSDQIGKENIAEDKYIFDERYIPYVNEYKFIIDEKTDETMLMNFVNNVLSKSIHSNKYISFYLSPMDLYDKKKNKENINRIMEIITRYPDIFKVNVQIHKILGLD